MKIEEEAFGLFPEKVKAVDTHPGLYIKKIFPEGDIIFELEVLF